MDLKIDGQNLALGQTGLPRQVAGFDGLLKNDGSVVINGQAFPAESP